MSTQDHVNKEILKQVIDNSPNYTDKMKIELKAIIDAAKSAEELCKTALAYFSAFNW